LGETSQRIIVNILFSKLLPGFCKKELPCVFSDRFKEGKFLKKIHFRYGHNNDAPPLVHYFPLSLF
jgi:hypothetical protein